jgi:hypothetical protein
MRGLVARRNVCPKPHAIVDVANWHFLSGFASRILTAMTALPRHTIGKVMP